MSRRREKQLHFLAEAQPAEKETQVSVQRIVPLQRGEKRGFAHAEFNEFLNDLKKNFMLFESDIMLKYKDKL